MTDLSVVVLTWNTKDMTLACLKQLQMALREVDRRRGWSSEVIIVDNGSTDGTAVELRQRFPEMELQENEENLGFAAGMNGGLCRAEGETVLLLNSDAFLGAATIEACLDTLSLHEEAGMVGPRLLHPDGRIQRSVHSFPGVWSEILPRFLIEARHARRERSESGEEAQALPVDALRGAVLFVRRALIEEVGPLPEEYFFFLEETDWCWQARKKGWQVLYVPGAPALHLLGESSKRRELLSAGEVPVDVDGADAKAQTLGFFGGALQLRRELLAVAAPGRCPAQERRQSFGGGGRKKGDAKLPPASVIVNFVGAKEFSSACVEEVLQMSIPVAMETVAATALQDSERIETAFDDLKKAFGGNDCAPIGDLTYSIGVEVVPTIKWTGDYRKLKVTVQSPGDDVTDAAEAESIFNAALRNLGTMRVVADRGLEVGDQVVMDLSAVNKATGEEIEGIKQEKFNLDTGAARLNLPGLVDGIVGMKTGETREVPITMPDDWPQAFIRGVEATFTITLRELFQNDVPAPTDDIASKIYPDASTIDDAKAKILESQKATTAAMLEQTTNEALVDALAAICDALHRPHLTLFFERLRPAKLAAATTAWGSDPWVRAHRTLLALRRGLAF